MTNTAGLIVVVVFCLTLGFLLGNVATNWAHKPRDK